MKKSNRQPKSNWIRPVKRRTNSNSSCSAGRLEQLEHRLLLAVDFVDALEVNDSFLNASILGSEPTVTLRDLSVHDLGDGDSNEDFYRITASETGMLLVNSLFDHEQGNLDLAVFDSRAFLVASSVTLTDNEQVVFPVVSQESYTVRINGASGASNSYALEIENFATAAPQGIFLDPQSDSGMMNNDSITADTNLRFTIQADVNALLEQGIPLLSADEASARNQSGAAVFVTVRDSLIGTVESGYANSLGDDLFRYTAADLPDGVMIVSASIHIFDPRRGPDPSEPSATIGDPVVGPSLQSPPISVTIDTESPIVRSPGMLPSSDSGMSQSDNVTNIMQPAFVGTAGPNEKIQIFAGGFLVGEGVANSDGRWEITVEPLTEGVHDMTIQATDLAGNSGESGEVTLIEIDKTAPNTPLLDLTSGSDTGLSDSDNVANDNSLSFTMTTTDLNSADHLNEFNFKYRLYVRGEGREEVLVYNSVSDASIPAENKEGGFTNLQFLNKTVTTLPRRHGAS